MEGTRSNRNGIGARVKVEYANQVRHAVVVSGSGFLSQDPMPLHFGLGKVDKVDKVSIRWPSGSIQVIENPAPDQIHRIVEN